MDEKTAIETRKKITNEKNAKLRAEGRSKKTFQ